MLMKWKKKKLMNLNNSSNHNNNNKVKHQLQLNNHKQIIKKFFQNNLHKHYLKWLNNLKKNELVNN